MVSTTGGFIDKSPMSPVPNMIVKKCSAIKSLRLFTKVLHIKNETAVRRVGFAKSMCKTIRSGSMLRSSIPKRKGHTKINEQVKEFLYNCILQHPQVS